LVESLRGPGGGYILAAPAEQINIAQIISAAEDRLDATQCGSKANCNHGAPCLTHDLWENLNKTINDYLSGVTLQSIIEQKNCSDSSHVVTFTHIH
jgi:putative HTH-type transcriptional regulator NMB1378